MLRSRPSLRAAAMLSAGSFVVHEGRYRLAFGSHASQALGRSGHAYLEVAAPVLAVALAALAGAGLVRMARALPPARHGPPPLLGLWAASAASLSAVFCTQELVEGALTTGHAGGAAAVLAAGGWLFVPLSLAVGGLVALGLRGADSALERAREIVAWHRPARSWPSVPVSLGVPTGRLAVVRGAVLAWREAGRAPPRTFVV